MVIRTVQNATERKVDSIGGFSLLKAFVTNVRKNNNKILTDSSFKHNFGAKT